MEYGIIGVAVYQDQSVLTRDLFRMNGGVRNYNCGPVEIILS